MRFGRVSSPLASANECQSATNLRFFSPLPPRPRWRLIGPTAVPTLQRLAKSDLRWQNFTMIARILGLLIAVSPPWLHAQQNTVVLTEEAHAELQAFAERNGYKSLSAAYKDFLAARADQKRRADEEATEMRKEADSLAVEIKRVKAQLSTEQTNLEILEKQSAAETDLDTRMIIDQRINRSEGRIELLQIEREALQKRLKDARRAAAGD